MKKIKSQQGFFDELAKVPIVQVACEKTNISRNSVYRWRKEDPEFSKKMDEALADGIAFMNDMGENQLLTLMKDKDFRAVSFWLKHRHASYKTKVQVSGSVDVVNELSSEQEQLVQEAFKLAGIQTHESD